MANTITAVLPKLLAQGLMALREQAIMPRLVNRSYEQLASQKGAVINVPIPGAISARDVTPANSFATNVDFTATSAVVTLDFWKEAPFQLSDKDFVEVMNGTIPMQASEAVKSLGNAIDAYILGKHTGFYGVAGSAGTTPFATNISAAGTARKLLNKQLAPMSDRRVVLDPDAEAAALELSNILQFDQRGDQGGIISGTIGRKLGMDWYMDQNVPEFETGGAWVTGWAADATTAAASGATSMGIENSTATGTIKVGDIFQINTHTDSQYYVVTAETTVASSAASISFYPPLTAAAASAASMTVIGTDYVANLAFHRDAFAWASRPLQDVEGAGHLLIAAGDPVSGVGLRLEISRQYKQTTFSYDVLGGANVIRPELGTKILG